MTEPRIVDAVEAARPDYWIGVSVSHGTVHLWSNIPRKSSDELMEGVNRFGESPQFIVRLPGTAAPPPATATDAVEELVTLGYEVEVYRDSDEHKYFWCHVRTLLGMDVETERADSIQAAAAKCLAKIRGAK